MIEQSFSVDRSPEIEISCSSGSLTVESGAAGTVQVTIDSRHPEAWRVLQSGNSVTVSYERGLLEFDRGGGRARIRIVTPDGSSLRANTASADVRAVLDLDRVTIASASGDVLLGDVRTAEIKTASGDITLGQVEDDLTARSASGDIRADSVGGDTSVITASGDVGVDRAEGSLSASSASGDVRVGRYLGEDLESSTMSGDLIVGLPPGRTVKLNARTLSGSVRLPERKPSSEMAVPVVSVRLKSVSGDITIRRLES